jgi:hypothetical protein
MLAWGIAPGIQIAAQTSAESAFQSGEWTMAPFMNKLAPELNRAFSADGFLGPWILGRLPQAGR